MPDSAQESQACIRYWRASEALVLAPSLSQMIGCHQSALSKGGKEYLNCPPSSQKCSAPFSIGLGWINHPYLWREHVTPFPNIEFLQGLSYPQLGNNKRFAYID